MDGQIYILICILFGFLLQVMGLIWAIARVIVRRMRSPARMADRVLFLLSTIIFVVSSLALTLFVVGQINRGGTLYPLLIALFVSTAGWVGHRWCLKKIAAEQM